MNGPKAILFAVSGHGFGHATRVAHLLKELHRRHPALQLLVHSAAPPWVWQPPASPPGVIHEPFSYDVGMIQKDSISVDLAGTLAALRHQRAAAGSLRQRFEETLASYPVTVVVADIPALPLRWAAERGVPALALGNFSWDVMYAEYAATHPEFQGHADECAAAYQHATVLLHLPLGHPMTAFTNVIEVPLLARRTEKSRAAIRAALGLEHAERVILLSFGGFAPARVRGFADRFDTGCHFLSFREWPGEFPGRLTVLGEAVPFPHEETVAAADMVIGKPGYGLISECLANRTPLLFIPRDDFPECRYLMAGAEEQGHARRIPLADFQQGRWRDHIEALLADDRPWPDLRCDGDLVIADRLEEYI